jgi:molybdate transport system substrate-binding protein
MATDIRMLSAGAVRSIVTELTDLFRHESGHAVTLAFATAALIQEKLTAGELADVVIATDGVIAALERQGVVAPGTRVDMARTAVGVGVREGAPRPDVSTPEAFKRTLLAARSLTYADPAHGATSGVHVAALLQRLGIADALASKTRLVPGGYPAELVARGEAELVVHQLSGIVPVKGVTLVGLLPGELQKLTVYSAGVGARTAAGQAARAFIAFLMLPAHHARFAAAGLEHRV